MGRQRKKSTERRGSVRSKIVVDLKWWLKTNGDSLIESDMVKKTSGQVTMEVEVTNGETQFKKK